MGGPKLDAEANARDLNTMLAYGRARVNPKTNEGCFHFGIKMDHWIAKRSDRLRTMLIGMGYLENRGAGPKNTRLWWVKPDGEITPADVRKYHQEKKRPDLRPHNVKKLEQENLKLRLQMRRNRRKLTRMRDTITQILEEA